jgi:hypothetical protein
MQAADIPERFNKLLWHDSKLQGIRIQRRSGSPFDEISLDIALYVDRQPNGYERRPVSITFSSWRYVRMGMDLESKRLCSDDISEAWCEKDSVLKKQIEEKISHEPMQARPEKERPLAEHYLFRILLITPGGEMIIVARNFELVMLE